jgi:hypothetical protein
VRQSGGRSKNDVKRPRTASARSRLHFGVDCDLGIQCSVQGERKSCSVAVQGKSHISFLARSVYLEFGCIEKGPTAICHYDGLFNYRLGVPHGVCMGTSPSPCNYRQPDASRRDIHVRLEMPSALARYSPRIIIICASLRLGVSQCRAVRSLLCRNRTSVAGQSRPNWAARVMSGLAPSATELRTSLVVRFVP